jgi:hypothetical protein
LKWLHRLLLLLGAALFVWLVSQVGLAAVWEEASKLGWGIVVIVLIDGLGDLLHTWGWQRCFAREHKPGLLRLWWPHLAGSAFNYVTPTATFGGEVVKGTLVPRGTPGREVVASLTVNKLTVTLADLILAVAGVCVLVASASLALEWKLGALAGGVLFVAGTAAFWVLQRRGQLAGLVGRRSVLRRLLGEERAARVAQLAEDIDERIADFHSKGRGDAAVSTLLHLAGKAIGAVQLALFFYWLEVPLGFFDIVSIFLVARAIELAAFFVPASLGTQEGGLMLAMSLVGIPVSLGLTFSLVLRLEQLFWTGVGFVAYAGVLWQRRSEDPPAVRPTGRT